MAGARQAKRLRVEVPGEGYLRALISHPSACPVRTDARGHVRAVSEGRLDEASASIACEALDRFVECHLRRLAAPFAQRLERSGSPVYLARAARALAARVGEAEAPLPRIEEDDSFHCA